MGKKVVIIGAGSVVFTSGLVADFIADGGEWEIGLVDIDQGSLDAIYGLAQRMVKEKAAPITLRASTERTELLSGADAVVTTLDVGGRRAWELDIQIPRKYGIFAPVADTTTPGGFARTLRIVPTMLDIARDIKRMAPTATFINYCNPMAAIVRAIRREVGYEVIGLCHGVPAAKKYFADFLGIDDERCTCRAVGFNHFVWIIDFTVDGKDGYAMIREKNKQVMAEGKLPGNDENSRLAWELFDVFGYFPLSRDRHITEFFPQFHPNGSHYGKILGKTRFSFEQWIIDSDASFERMKKLAQGNDPLPDNLFHEKLGDHEKMVCILRALEKPTTEVYHVNVPNTGQVPNLPRDIAIECPVEFSTAGVKPVQMPAIAPGIRACIEKAFLTTELMIDAAVQRDRAKFVQAIIVDGCTRSVADSNKLADELLAAHKQFLPGW